MLPIFVTSLQGKCIKLLTRAVNHGWTRTKMLQVKVYVCRFNLVTDNLTIFEMGVKSASLLLLSCLSQWLGGVGYYAKLENSGTKTSSRVSDPQKNSEFMHIQGQFSRA